MQIKVPYGDKWEDLYIPDHLSWELLEANLPSDVDDDEKQLVSQALEAPIASCRLREMAEGKRNAVIIISDHTRPVPSKHIIPAMLEELRSLNPNIDISLLVATGCHRGTTESELREKLGDEIVNRERIIVHDCMSVNDNVKVGNLPSGAPLVINRYAADTELLLSEGLIEPHFFAGFSGGRKSILPGICDRKTILSNHCSTFIDNPYSRAGTLENNPINRDMAAAAGLAKLAFIVNVVINKNKRIVRVYAGEPAAAHAAGCAFSYSHSYVKPKQRGDIVITSNGGAPLDQNIYQAVKGLTAAESAAAQGAVLIICAACNDGTGGDNFYRTLRDCKSPYELLERVRQTSMQETQPDQWQYQILAEILSKHKVTFVAEPQSARFIRDMKMTYAPNLQKAFDMTRSIAKPSPHVVIIPDGVSVIVDKIKENHLGGV